MPLETEFRTYEEMREELERRCLGKYVLIHERELVAVFDDLTSALGQAERLFCCAPFLIRQVGMDELHQLTDQITSDNRHEELRWGKSAGREVW